MVGASDLIYIDCRKEWGEPEAAWIVSPMSSCIACGKAEGPTVRGGLVEQPGRTGGSVPGIRRRGGQCDPLHACLWPMESPAAQSAALCPAPMVQPIVQAASQGVAQGSHSSRSEQSACFRLSRRSRQAVAEAEHEKQ